jgi:nitrate reductase (cytochrome), electron transfer subunit
VTASVPNGRFGRAVSVVAAAAMAAAVIGFFTGVRRVPEPRGYLVPDRVPAAEGALEAPTHGELGVRRMGDNRTRHPAGLAALVADRPPLTEEVEPSPEARRAALERRARQRAYDGAPPTIPHPIEQRGYPSCMTCHAEGMRVFGKSAPPMSHPELGSCTQCHVVEQRPVPTEAPLAGGPPTDTLFVGAVDPGPGERAWPGAPPTIPHRTHMRERCGSCHGVLASGLRTSHPWRQSCAQCHAPSAGLDQRPPVPLGPGEEGS